MEISNFIARMTTGAFFLLTYIGENQDKYKLINFMYWSLHFKCYNTNQANIYVIRIKN